ncbi:MAG: hypothetical protein IJ934_00840 [Acetobacter sp.]|nr:hypothetical protein [Acetobacter sp.]
MTRVSDTSEQSSIFDKQKKDTLGLFNSTYYLSQEETTDHGNPQFLLQEKTFQTKEGDTTSFAFLTFLTGNGFVINPAKGVSNARKL